MKKFKITLDVEFEEDKLLEMIDNYNDCCDWYPKNIDENTMIMAVYHDIDEILDNIDINDLNIKLVS